MTRAASWAWHVLRWLLATLFILLALSSGLRGGWVPAGLMLLSAVLILPVMDRIHEDRGTRLLEPAIRAALTVVALTAFALVQSASAPETVYASTDVQERVYRIYDEKMEEWPVPYEDRFIETEFGRVHVIVSGDADAPPLLLLHASGVAGWSWKYNAEGLSRAYRIYGVDLIGDAGKSELRSREHVLRTGEDQARLYAEIMDSLEIASAGVVGASEGGFIATNLALHHPDRVEKLVLLGPMGYAGATKAIIRIALTMFFPLESIQRATFAWAFSDLERLQEDFGEWFGLVMDGLVPAKVAPFPFPPEDRQRLEVPVLFVFGERDNLVGDPGRAEALVQDVPDVTVAVVDAGHLMGAERPDEVNRLILDFLGPPEPTSPTSTSSSASSSGVEARPR